MNNALRSLLFIPGNKRNMLDKAFTCTADVIVPDLEDSVPDAEKHTARQLVAEYLPQLRKTDRWIIPRVNSLATGLTEAELDAIVSSNIDAISIGKIHSAADIHEVAEMILRFEQLRGLEPESIKLIPWIESAKAIVNCFDICAASSRVVAVAFGGEDYTNDMEIERSTDETQTLFARSTICNSARAADVVALDTPFFRFRDLDGLQEHSETSKRLGFKGRFAIHPGQTDVINTCYSPSQSEIENAQRVVAAFEEAERNGRASTSLNGMVIDVPVVKRARAILKRL